MELSVPQAEEEEAVNKQSTTILEQVRQKILRYIFESLKQSVLLKILYFVGISHQYGGTLMITLKWFLQALCRAEDEEDIVAASQAKAEQVAELAEFNENIPLDDGGEQEEVEELSKAEQEIAALVEQVNNYAFL